MINWQDSGYVVSVRKHGENSAILSVLTHEHGKQTGLVRGATGARLRGVLQIGNQVDAAWQARLESHLGYFKIELQRAWSSLFFEDALRLAALRSAAALIESSVPEREAHPDLHEGFGILLEALAHVENWPAIYAKFELGLLQVLGFGLALEQCAATGSKTGLEYVSPRTGRAVSRAAGAPYHDKLLALPGFLTAGANRAETEDVLQALTLSAYFLERHVWQDRRQREPEARLHLIRCLQRDLPAHATP